MQKKIKGAKGITLVALIITVIILLILAGVTISLVIGENGLIAKSKQAEIKTEEKAFEEDIKLALYDYGINEENTRVNKLIEELRKKYEVELKWNKYVFVRKKINNQICEKVIELETEEIKNKDEIAIGNSTMTALYNFYMKNDENGYKLKGNDIISISNKDELIYLSEYTNAGKITKDIEFILKEDIYLNDTSDVINWNVTPPENNWIPIGNETNPFQGILDGEGKNILGMYINIDSTTTFNYGGLIGIGKECSIKNINIKEGYAINKKNNNSVVAGFAGKLNDSLNLENLNNYVTIQDDNSGAGICAEIYTTMENSNINITNCNNYGEVKGDYASGIINEINIEKNNTNVQIKECSNKTNIIGVGLINEINCYEGESYGCNIEIKRCYNTGNINSNGSNAGIVDSISYAGKNKIEIKQCYNTGNITGGNKNNTRVGGIIAMAYGERTDK